MQLIAIALGGCVALFWGLADSFATLSARRLTTFQTTLISQVTGLHVLMVLFVIVRASNLPITLGLSLENVGVGILTGAFAFVGYLSLYQALEAGPIAITSPLSSTSAVVTLALSMLILHERVSFPEGIALSAAIVGVILVSTRYQDILALLQKRSSEFSVKKGICWAYVAMMSLGCMDFGVGARTPSAGWFAPVYWTRTFSVLFLYLTAFYPARRRKQISVGSRTITTSMRKLSTDRSASSPHQRQGFLLAIIAGTLESAAISAFGLATQITQPGVIATIASYYALVAILFGVFVFRERLVGNQLFGIGLLMCALGGLAYLRS